MWSFFIQMIFIFLMFLTLHAVTFNTQTNKLRIRILTLTCTLFQSECPPSCSPEMLARSCFACLYASRHMRQYSVSIQNQINEKTGVTMPAIYHGGNTSSNSHSVDVAQLFQNNGIAPIIEPDIQPIIITVIAIRLVIHRL